MAKVMLISPPWNILMGLTFNEVPIGLSYLAAILKKAGHETVIFNADFAKTGFFGGKQVLEKFEVYQKALHDLNNPVWQNVLSEVKKFSPDIVGIHAKTGSITAAQNTAKLIKQFNPKIKTVVGGPHPTIKPKETAEFKYFDFVVFGEGEKTIEELVNRLSKKQSTDKVLGIAFKKNGKLKINAPRPFIENLDELPFPDRDALLYKEEYPNFAFGLIMSARGCPFNCIYCASKKVWGQKTRFRSPKNFIAEIKQIKQKYGTNFFKIRDDTFTVNKERAIKICDLMINEKLGITWHCDTRADCVDEELIKKMKEAGCTEASIGIESGSERILKFIKKGETKQQMEKAIALFRKHGIAISIFLMMGFPTETEEEIKETMEFAKKLKPDSFCLSIVTPYPGTELYEIAKSMGLLKTEPDYDKSFHLSPEMGLSEKIGRKKFKLIAKKYLRETDEYNTNPLRLAHRFFILFFKNPKAAIEKAIIFLR